VTHPNILDESFKIDKDDFDENMEKYYRFCLEEFEKEGILKKENKV